MVIAGVVSDGKIGRFKDSKELSKEKRVIKFSRILSKNEKIFVYIIFPGTIDHYRSMKKLNKLELKILNLLRLQTNLPIIADFPEDIGNVNGMKIKHGLDKKYKCVSEASIIAKVLRDSFVRYLRYKYGDFGSGYPSDEKTISFLKKKIIPRKYIRTSWKTFKKIGNTNLFDYI